MRDADGLVTQVDAVLYLVRQGQPAGEIRRAMIAVNRTTGSIAARIGRTDPTVQRGWWNVTQAIGQVNSLLGVTATPYADPNQPVILNRPVWDQFPVETGPPPGPSPRARDAVALADEIISEADQYIAALQPLVPRSRSTAPAVLISRLQNLQQLTIGFRQTITNGSINSHVERAAQFVIRDNQELQLKYNEYLPKEPRLGSPWPSRIDDTVRRLRQVVFQ